MNENLAENKYTQGFGVFGTKSKNLELLNKHASSFKVLPQLCVYRSDWKINTDKLLESIWTDSSLNHPLIVRSSFSAEDSDQESHAGEFQSILNVSSKKQLKEAINSVFTSYGNSCLDEHVLIQPMAQNVTLNGVIMTSDARSYAPYTIINYVIGEDTEAVTSGEKLTKKFVLLNEHYSYIDDSLSCLIPVIKELNIIFNNRPMDIEFAITKNNEVIIFQVRPIVIDIKKTDLLKNSFPNLIKETFNTYSEIIKHNKIVGLTGGLFGVMPDWNPAELIGTKPKPLAYSLYRYLVTDAAWTKGRIPLGYTDMTGFPLMSLIGGIPYISLETSLSSFVPAKISSDLRSKIVSDACKNLIQEPHNHDKIEFAIMPTVYTPEINTKKWRDRFSSLSDNEWAIYLKQLLELTNQVLTKNGSYNKFQKDFNNFLLKCSKNQSSKSLSLISVRSLLSSVKDEATPLFSTAARAAFIATAILKSLSRMGLITQNYIDELSKKADTIGSQLVKNYTSLPENEFMKIYGHIRPGTFDITVPRYDVNPSHYFSTSLLDKKADVITEKSLKEDFNKDNINQLFRSVGYTFSWDEFEKFAIDALNARENVKFHYTKLVSDSLEIIAHIGEKHGYSRETMSFLTLADIENLLDFTTDLESKISFISRINKIGWEKTLPIRLPELLTRPEDIYAFHILESTPNFITNKLVEGVIGNIEKKDLKEKIIFIENADPGYDWIFTHGVKGFVTKYGGENSHMAIRAREFSLPAVIGAGSSYDDWKNNSILRIDCAVQNVQVIA